MSNFLESFEVEPIHLFYENVAGYNQFIWGLLKTKDHRYHIDTRCRVIYDNKSKQFYSYGPELEDEIYLQCSQIVRERG